MAHASAASASGWPAREAIRLRASAHSCAQSEPFVRALRQAGHAVRECPVIGAGHYWFSEEPPEEPGSFAAFLAPHLLRFLKRHL